MGCRKWLTSVNKWLGLQEFDPKRVVTSNLLSPMFLLIFRFLSALYMTIVWCVAVAISKGKFFSYFTNLSYSGLVAYFWTVAFHSLQFVRFKDTRSIQRQPTCLTVALYMLYSTILPFHVIIPIIYWALLFDGSYMRPVEGWRDISVHALDFVFILLEVIFNRMQMTFRLILVPVIVMLLYMFLTWIIRAVYDYWVYPFLAWQPRAGYIYPSIAVFLVLVYSIVYGVHVLKERIWEKKRSQVHAENERNAMRDLPTTNPTYPPPVHNARGGDHQQQCRDYHDTFVNGVDMRAL